MTPSTTFQCPLSPGGTFHPERSLPLKSDVNPSGGSSFAHKFRQATAKIAATNSDQPMRDMIRPPLNLSRCCGAKIRAAHDMTVKVQAAAAESKGFVEPFESMVVC